MFIFKYFLPSLMVLMTAISAFAAPQWSERMLRDAKTQAANDIDQYLQQHSGPVAQYIDLRTAGMIEQAQYSLRNNKQLNFMTNPLPVIDSLAKLSRDTQQRFGLQYLAVSFADNKIERLYDLYAEMIAEDKANLPFAFAELEKISSQFDSLLQQRYQTVLAQYRFSLDNIEVDRTQENPEICLQFSDRVLRAQQWQDEIHFSPQDIEQPVYKNNRLCYQGKWQTEYRITADKNLLSQYRLPLYSGSQTRTVNTGEPQLTQPFDTCRQKPLLIPNNHKVPLKKRAYHYIIASTRSGLTNICCHVDSVSHFRIKNWQTTKFHPLNLCNL